MKLTKVLLGSSLAIPAVAIPLSTLTSCSQNWGSLTPFTIGGLGEANPYSNIDDCYDANGELMNDYLQSHYSVQVGGNTNYAYSHPEMFKDESETEKEKSGWVLGTPGWYTSSDSVFVPSAVDKYKEGGEEKTEVVTSARNSALASNVDFIAAIGTTINNYINYALQYQASQIKVDDDKPGSEEDLQIAWGSQSKNKFVLKHGTAQKDIEAQNSIFFEYLFALSNLNGPDKVSAMLRTSQCNFYFNSFGMPLPSYKWNEDKRLDLSDGFNAVLEGVDYYTTPQRKYYSVKSETVKEDEDEYVTYTYESVPILVRLFDIKQTYVNPNMGTSSFLVNDYYSDAKQISDAVGDQWKDKMSVLTSLDKKDCIPHYKSFDLLTSGIAIQPVTDLRLERQSIRGGLPTNSFVVLVNYTVKECTTNSSKTTATINSLSNIFPTFYLDIFEPKDLYKDNGPNDDHKDLKVFDTNKINNISNRFLELLQRSAGQGLVPRASDLNQDSKNLLGFLGYIFGDAANEIDTDEVIYPEKI